jgi:hypothetical protein
VAGDLDERDVGFCVRTVATASGIGIDARRARTVELEHHRLEDTMRSAVMIGVRDPTAVVVEPVRRLAGVGAAIDASGIRRDRCRRGRPPACRTTSVAL